MTWFRCGLSGTKGVIFNHKLILDNSSHSSNIEFSKDYHYYALLEIVIFNSSTSKRTSIITSPEMIDNIFTYSSNHLNLNEFGNNQYCEYEASSTLEWVMVNNRNCVIDKIYGIECNKTISKTALYNKEGISAATEIPITSVDSFLEYDLILFSTCDGNPSETQPCVLYAEMPKANKIKTQGDNITFVYNRYGAYYPINISEHLIEASKYYFYVQGIKFN